MRLYFHLKQYIVTTEYTWAFAYLPFLFLVHTVYGDTLFAISLAPYADSPSSLHSIAICTAYVFIEKKKKERKSCLLLTQDYHTPSFTM